MSVDFTALKLSCLCFYCYVGRLQTKLKCSSCPDSYPAMQAELKVQMFNQRWVSGLCAD